MNFLEGLVQIHVPAVPRLWLSCISPVLGVGCGVWGVGMGSWKTILKLLLAMGSTNPRVKLFPMWGVENTTLLSQRCNPFFSMQQRIQQLIPVRWAAVPQDQMCKRPGDVLKELWPAPGGSFSVVFMQAYKENYVLCWKMDPNGEFGVK